LNPAVTLAFSCSRLFPWKKVAPYMLSQYLAAFMASAVVYLVYIGF
jgi:glycerol uptake facilitator-like aquaporin